jgi:hypothetical protein
MAFVFSILVLQIAVLHVGTIDSEHSFGVMRHQTAGNYVAGSTSESQLVVNVLTNEEAF